VTGHTDSPASVRRGEFGALLFAVFAVALGFGVILPILPVMVERLIGTSDPAAVARHTALLTAIFVAAPLATALPWGRLADRVGRRPVLVAGLIGFAVTLAASAFAPGLPLLYAGRLLNGAFAAAVVPAALAFVADRESDEHKRARSFGWVSVANSLGFFVGPMLGGIASAWGGGGGSGEALPFLLAAAAAVAAAMAVSGVIPGGPPLSRTNDDPRPTPASGLSGEVRLLFLASVAAGGLGVFEVGLTLRSRELLMTPALLGLMFATCSLVMLAVQGTVLSRLFKPATTRWFIAPSFAALGIGLALVAIAGGSDGLLVATAIAAASAGLLAPVLAYWVSRISRRGQGAELGLQTAAVSFGQSLGAAAPGLAFLGGPGAVLWLSAGVMVAGIAASAALPRQLSGTGVAADSKRESRLQRRTPA
jgi:MFS family permease